MDRWIFGWVLKQAWVVCRGGVRFDAYSGFTYRVINHHINNIFLRSS
jgi:hypothetical protein